MMQFTGSESMRVPAETAFDKLINLDFIQGGIPDLVSAQKEGDSALNCKVRPSVSFLKGTLDLRMEVVERERPHTARMKIHGKGIGASIDMETTLKVVPSADNQSCHVEWSSQIVQLGGLLKAVSKGLIEGLATKVSRQTWDGIRQRLEAGN